MAVLNLCGIFAVILSITLARAVTSIRQCVFHKDKESQHVVTRGSVINVKCFILCFTNDECATLEVDSMTGNCLVAKSETSDLGLKSGGGMVRYTASCRSKLDTVIGSVCETHEDCSKHMEGTGCFGQKCFCNITLQFSPSQGKCTTCNTFGSTLSYYPGKGIDGNNAIKHYGSRNARECGNRCLMATTIRCRAAEYCACFQTKWKIGFSRACYLADLDYSKLYMSNFTNSEGWMFIVRDCV